MNGGAYGCSGTKKPPEDTDLRPLDWLRLACQFRFLAAFGNYAIQFPEGDASALQHLAESLSGHGDGPLIDDPPRL
jgi:hypothetical protein